MKAIRIILVALFAMLMATGCGLPFFGTNVRTGTLQGGYKAQAALNLEGVCTPQMMDTIWKDMKEWHYHPLTDEQLFASGLAAVEKKIGKCVEIASDSPRDFASFWFMLDRAHNESRDTLSSLCYTALRGMVDGLDDPFARFFDAQQGRQRFQAMTAADYSGVGFTMIADYDAGRLFVDFVFRGSSADGRLRRFDEILSIDDRDIGSVDLRKIAKRLRGPSGSEVVLVVQRPGHDAVEMRFKRKVIQRRTARCDMRDGIAYCRLTYFAPLTAKYFVEEIKNLPKHSNRMVLDLRNNPGGLLFSATHISRMWIGKRNSVVLMRPKEGAVSFNDPTEGAILKDYKTVVLTNGATASSSELLAAALRDHGRAIFVGERTFGKGVSQRTRFVLGSVVSFTSMYFLSPHGHVIHGRGIVPDVPVKMSMADVDAGRDPQLRRALLLVAE